mgnify:CR=1 FL=1
MKDKITNLQKLKNHVQEKSTIRAAAIGLNAIIGVLMGLFFRDPPFLDQNSANNSIVVVIGLLLIAAYIWFNIWIFYSDSSDKIEFIDRIKYKDELSLQREFKESLILGLSELSEQTCQTVKCTIVCDEEKLKERLTAITQPLYKTISKLLESKITILTYIEGYGKYDNPKDGIKSHKKIFLLHDELELKKEIDADMFDKTIDKVKNFNKYIYGQISESSHDAREMYYSIVFEENHKPESLTDDFSIISQHIPIFCTSRDLNPKGALVVLIQNENLYDGELDSFFELYGWIISSYIDQYNICVEKHLDKDQKDSD